MSAVLMAAAASLTDILTELGTAFERAQPGTTVRFTFAASGVLLQQVQQGAPIDLFVSASPRELDTLEKAGKLVAGSRTVLAGNQLALIAPQASRLRGWDDLRDTKCAPIALGKPEFVPAGRYAQQVLTRRGLWESVAARAVYGANVRQTLAYVATGDAAAGLVFLTDARRERRVKVVALAAATDHEPILYPAAVIAGSANAAAARSFLAFLRSKPTQAVFVRNGFLPAGR